MIGALLSLVLFQAPVDDTPIREGLTHAIERRLQIPWYAQRGQTRHWSACRRAPGGCEARVGALVDYIVDAAYTYEVSPYVLAAMAWSETRFNPWAQGGVGEIGMFQIHPKNRQNLRFTRKGGAGERYRKACAKEVGACQYEVAQYAASRIATYTDKCGSTDRALSAYNTGKCGSETGAKYARRILRMAGDLEHEVDGAGDH